MKKYVKIALVTGASSGIGRATAKEFAKLGYNLIITGRRKARLQEIKEKLSYKYGVDVKVLAFDIGNSTAAEKAFNSLPKEWRNKIHILVNNAGGAKNMHGTNATWSVAQCTTWHGVQPCPLSHPPLCHWSHATSLWPPVHVATSKSPFTGRPWQQSAR